MECLSYASWDKDLGPSRQEGQRGCYPTWSPGLLSTNTRTPPVSKAWSLRVCTGHWGVRQRHQAGHGVKASLQQVVGKVHSSKRGSRLSSFPPKKNKTKKKKITNIAFFCGS